MNTQKVAKNKQINYEEMKAEIISLLYQRLAEENDIKII